MRHKNWKEKKRGSYEKNVQDNTSPESNYNKRQDCIPQVYLPSLYGFREEYGIPRSDECTLGYFQERQNLEQPLCMTVEKQS